MRYENFLIAASLLHLITSYHDFKNNEIEVALEIFKELNIGHCLLVVKNLQSIILKPKEVYAHKNFLAHIQKEQLKLYFNKTQLFHVKIGFLINIDSINFLQDLFEKNPLEVSQITWLIFTNEHIAPKLNVPYNCQFLTIQLNKENEYLIKSIYYVKNIGPFAADFGNWAKSSGLVRNKKFDEHRKNMRGVELIRGDSYGFEKGKVCHNFSIEEKHREIWSEYSRLLNFSFVVVKEGMHNGPMAPDGTPCVMVQHSLNYFPDAVFPTGFSPLHMVIKFESDIGHGWKAFFKPFDSKLWYSIFGFITISIAAFKMIEYFTKSIMNPFAAFYSFCFQDGADVQNEKFTTISSSIAYLMPYVVATVIVPAYSAAILAKLTVQLPKVPFTDLETFAQDGTYKLASLNNTFVNMYFMRSKHPLVSRIYQEMFLNKEEYPNIDSEAIHQLCNKKKFAFIPYYLSHFEKDSNCKIFKVPKQILHLYTGFKMRINSPFKQIFKKQLSRLYASGIMRRKSKRTTEENGDEELFVPITFSQILPILHLIPLGMFLSLISLFLEIYKRKRKIF